MKRALTIVLSLIILAISPTSLAAKKKTAAIEAPPQIIPAYIMTSGTVRSINISKKTIEITKDDGTGNLTLLLDKEMRVVDNDKKTMASLHAIKKGAKIYAWHANRYYGSSPLSADAYAVVTNVTPGQPLPVFVEIDSVTRSANTYKYYTQPQDIVLSVESSLKINYFNSNKSGNIGSLRPGSRFLAYTAATAADENEKQASSQPNATLQAEPLQLSASAILLFDYPYDGYMLMDQNYININGYMLTNKAISDESGNTFIPAIEALEKFGLRYRYKKTDNILSVLKNNKTIGEFKANSDTYTIDGKSAVAPSPLIEEDVFYVEINALLGLVNYKTIIKK